MPNNFVKQSIYHHLHTMKFWFCIKYFANKFLLKHVFILISLNLIGSWAWNNSRLTNHSKIKLLRSSSGIFGNHADIYLIERVM